MANRCRALAPQLLNFPKFFAISLYTLFISGTIGKSYRSNNIARGVNLLWRWTTRENSASAMRKDREIKRYPLTSVIQLLQEKGYNPINQIVGYILSEDPHLYHQLQQRPCAEIRRLDGTSAGGAGESIWRTEVRQ